MDLTDAHKFVLEDLAVYSCLSLVSEIKQLHAISAQHLRGSNTNCTNQTELNDC